jgi:uncharacterized protein YqhQ
MHILYIRTYINLYIYIHIHTVYIYICCTQSYFFHGETYGNFQSCMLRLIVLVHFIFCIGVLGNVDSSKPVTARNRWGDFGAW